MLSRFFATKLHNTMPVIYAGEYLIKPLGEKVCSENFYYCLGILIPTKTEYGFMHFHGCENFDKDRLKLNQMIHELRENSANHNLVLKAQIYCNLQGDEYPLPIFTVSPKTFDPASILSRMQHNISAVTKNLEENKVGVELECGGSKNIFVNEEGKIKPMGLLTRFGRGLCGK